MIDEATKEEELFHFHEKPNAECPVGQNIHKVMDGRSAAAQRAMENELKSVTLAEIVSDTRKIIGSE